MFCQTLAQQWQNARQAGNIPDWQGAYRISDWVQSVLARAALTGPGRSIRSFERRLQRWTKQTRRSLTFYSNFETLHQFSQDSTVSLSALAFDAGYADQSHMGRAVRRATGFSPAHLNRRIKTDESFWCYRLLGERL